MNFVRQLIQLTLITLVVSCLLTPPIYSILMIQFPGMGWPYSRVFDRVFMVVVIIGILMMRHSLQLGELAKQLYPRALRVVGYELLLGFISAVLVFVPFYASIVQLAGYEWAGRSATQVIIKSARILPIAFLIAFIEECVFRGLVLNSFKQTFGVRMALVVSSLVYSFVHFVSPIKSYVYPGFSIFEGFQYIWEVLYRMFTIEVWPSYLGLFLVGLILGLIYLRTSSIYLCVGIHAGWISVIKYAKYTTIVPENLISHSAAADRYHLLSFPVTWTAVLMLFPLVMILRTKITGPIEA